MKLIDKDKIVAEIEKRIKELQDLFKEDEKKLDSFQKTAIHLCIDECKVVLNILDTIETKEVNSIWNDARKTIPEDSSSQIVCIKEDGLAVSTIGKIVNGTIKWAYLNDLLNISNVQVKEVEFEKEDFTWKDIREIYIIFAEIDAEIEFCKTDIQGETIGYYQEALKRFKSIKEGIKL